jgi:hypothetical protein
MLSLQAVLRPFNVVISSSNRHQPLHVVSQEERDRVASKRLDLHFGDDSPIHFNTLKRRV